MINNTFELLWRDISPFSVGFDRTIDTLSLLANSKQTSNYPPYNIVRSGENKYDIEIALAGFNRDDIDVSVQDSVLTIETKSINESSYNESNEVIHRGISKRYFKKLFTLSSDVEVHSAELKDGLLKISMERIIPENKKRQTIDVS